MVVVGASHVPPQVSRWNGPASERHRQGREVIFAKRRLP
jgi:hypothetical protein